MSKSPSKLSSFPRLPTSTKGTETEAQIFIVVFQKSSSPEFLGPFAAPSQGSKGKCQ